MVEEIRNELTEQLFDAVLALENKDECYSFFRDIATVGEIESLSQRFEVARMLRQGVTYEKIVEETGVSTATISRVKRALEYGEGGYEILLDRLETE